MPETFDGGWRARCGIRHAGKGGYVAEWVANRIKEVPSA